MSSAVRGTSSAQGGSLAAGSGASASHAAPADGASFGGVLGAAMSAPASQGATDGNAKGGHSDQSGGGQPSASTDPTILMTDGLTPAEGTLAAETATSAASGATAPLGIDPTARNVKKTANPTSTPSPSAAQAAMVVVASLAPAAANSAGAASTAAGATTARTTTAGAVAGLSGIAAGSLGATSATLSSPPSSVAGATPATASHELAGPEDGTGPREPDGIDPASATVGRPAAMASVAANALPPVIAPSNTPGSAATPVSGSADRSSMTAAASAVASAVPTLTSTAVFAAPGAGERDSGHGSSVTGGDIRSGTLASGTPAASDGVIAASLSGPTSTVPSPGAGSAAGTIGVIVPDGSSQPLANALGSQVLAMVAAGRSQVTVHLTPPDLGTLTVRIEVQSRDVSAWFASPQPQVQSAVSDALAQLHGVLGGAGLNLAGAWVGADVSGGNGRPTAAPVPQRRAAPVAAIAETPAAGIATPAEGLSVYA